MFFIRKNDFSSNREFKFINKPAEMVVGRIISKKLMSDQKNYIYKLDTEEVQLVKRVLIKLINENNLQKQFFNGEVDVTLVHNDTIMMFLNLD